MFSKSFVIDDATALVSDMVYSYKNILSPVQIDAKTFQDYWKKQYVKSSSKISLASLTEQSKTSSKKKALRSLVFLKVSWNSINKKDARLGASEMPPCLTDMNEAAREGRYAPCIGRSEEIKMVIRTLLQPKNKSLVLLGSQGLVKQPV